MEIVNLNYTEHNNYYSLYLNNNESLNNIINTNIQNYNFEYNPEKYYQQNDDLTTRNIYENSGITIMLNSIIQGNIYGYCIIKKRKYLCEKMYFCNATNSKYEFYTHHYNCKSKDCFIIYFLWEYYSPICIYYPNRNEIYNISYRYNDINNFVNSNIKNSIKLTNFVNVKPNYISYVIGIMSNAGHYFWNEILGLMFIVENNLLDNINEFLIYKYDYLNIGDILKNKYNKNVIYLSNDNNHNATCNVTKHFVNTSLINTFNTFYGLNDNMCNNSKEINILFDIRSNSRVWLNQKPMILNIIHRLKEKYTDYKINFYISGFYKYEHNELSNNYLYDEEIQKQNELFNFVQNNLDFKIFNLINMNLSEIMKMSENMDLFISNIGSGISFFYGLIFNKPVVAFTNKKCSVPFNFQRYSVEHRVSNTLFIHPSNIIQDKNENFYIKVGILLNKVIETIDKIIIGKIK